MSGHTPGPWIIELESPNDVVSDVYDVEICCVQPVDRGGPKLFNYGAETVANANLIMAAPDLLAALEECLDYGSMTGDESITDRAIAAIARAKGETA